MKSFRFLSHTAAAIVLWNAPALYAQIPFITPEYRIVIDPGHGGINNSHNDDKWNPVTGAYLEPYAFGMSYQNLNEHEVVMDLARQLKYYTDLTLTGDGWTKFQEILKTFSPGNQFERIRLDAVLTRTESWNQRFSAPDVPEVNAPYRLYDFPDPQSRNIMPGRISQINKVQPSLVVSLHLNPAEGQNPGGMAAVLAPGYRTFDLLREITIGQKSISLFRRLPWYNGWLVTDVGWNKFESARADAWVYFHGYRSLKNGSGPWLQRNRGIRYNMVSWSYRDDANWTERARRGGPGPYSMVYRDFRATGRFWDREKSRAELWRREDGEAGYGGDNHFASDELLRFVQYGVRLMEPAKRANGAIGPIQTPFVSTYAIPTFVNAICAYLEIGFLNRDRDRALVINSRDAVAKSLAVGIYSLFRGISLRGNYGPYRPRGKPVNFSRYENYEGGNYFEAVEP